MRRAWLLLVLLALPMGMHGQRPAERRCLLEVVNVDREGVRSLVFGSNEYYFAGGDVRLRCVDQEVFLRGDSLESYNGELIILTTGAQYRDADVTIDADTLTYTRATETLQARGNVRAVNRLNGSILEGPWVDHLRAVRGIRDSAMTTAINRPTVNYAVAAAPGDTGTPPPYIISADGMRARGSSDLSAWGGVTIDRDSLHGQGDSLSYATADSIDVLTLLGAPARLARSGADSFDVVGQVVRLGVRAEELRSVHAYIEALVTSDVGVVSGDSVALMLNDGLLEQTHAWVGAQVLAGGYDVVGDSVAIDTPGERLSELRVFGNGTVTEIPDSVLAVADTAGAEEPIRSTMTGQLITARFVDVDSSGTLITRINDIVAIGRATSLFARDVVRDGAPSPTINYTRADTIEVIMSTGDSAGVEVVKARGAVDGVQLERETIERQAPADTTAAARREEQP